MLDSENTPLFAINDLSFRYPHGPLVLRGIDLAIAPGDRLAIVGPNGSGKSTLAKHLNGLLSIFMGDLFYKGQPLSGQHLEQARFEIGLLFQDPDDHLFCNTLFEDVAFGPMNQGRSREKVEQIVDVRLEQVGLRDYRNKAAHCLSYGQKKRAALAAIMAMEPEILVLDEPTANLDPKQVEIIIELLNNYHGTLICISHDLFFLQEICTRALVLEKGKVHHDFSMKELMAAPSALRVHGLDYSFRYSCCQGNRIEDSPVNPDLLNLLGQEGSGTARPLKPVISLHDYSFDFPDGTLGLDLISLAINRGECVALIGENGAGKSTLASCLIGILAGRGGYYFNSREVTAKKRKHLWKDIGIIFQDSADQLFCPTCKEEVAFGLKQRKIPKEEIEEKVREALAMVKLEGYESRSPLELSGGERKRLAIASAICLEPQVLIMDEPTAGLDPSGEEMFLAVIEKLEMTKILISHDMFFIKNHCQRALVMHEGKILFDCSIEDLFKDNNLISKNRLDYSLPACHLHP